MVKALFLGLLAVMMCGFVCAAPATAVQLVPQLEVSPSTSAPAPPLEDPAIRSERSTNLSYVTGTARKIQMFIKNRHLQLLPDGTVNGTTDDTSAYTIIQRTTVGVGQMKIQGVATCQYLCMDSCGLLYGSREFGDECVFNETMEQHHYNTYSSSKYSNDKRTFYLALNRRGQPRRVVLRAGHQLGRLTTYTRVLTRKAPEHTEELQLHPMRHHGHACPSPQGYNPHQTHQPHQSPDPPRCRKRRKRKKKKRKCLEDDPDYEQCQKKLKCDRDIKNNKDSEECQRDVTNMKKKQKTNNNNSDKQVVSVPKKKKNRKGVKKRLEVANVSSEATTTTISPTGQTTPDDVNPDEDYAADVSTHSEWDDSTALPDISMAVSEAKLTSHHLTESD